MIKNNKKNLNIILFILIFAVICFIWGNSIMPPDASALHSGKIVKLVKKIFDPNDRIPYDILSLIIRKLAHFFEFALLGFLCGVIRLCYRKISIFAVLYAPLLVAVIDETIQSVNGRGSSTRDVLLDHMGAVTGLVVSIIMYNTLISSYRKLKSRNNNEKTPK